MVTFSVLARPKWAEMAKIKSRSKILILSYVLGDHLTFLKTKRLFQSGPYLSGYGYRFTAIFKIVVKSRCAGSQISTNMAPIEIILLISGVVRIRRSCYVSEKELFQLGPYLLRYGYRFTAISENRGAPVAISQRISIGLKHFVYIRSRELMY
jgi:hypothetical protein